MGLHREHGHVGIPDRQGGHGQDDAAALRAGAHGQDVRGDGAYGRGGHQRRGRDAPQLLPAAADAVRAGHPGQEQFPFLQGEAAHHPRPRPPDYRRGVDGTERPAGCRRRDSAAAAAQRGALRGRAAATHRRPAAARPGGDAPRRRDAAWPLHHPVLLRLTGAGAHQLCHRGAAARLPPAEPGVREPAQPCARQPADPRRPTAPGLSLPSRLRAGTRRGIHTPDNPQPPGRQLQPAAPGEPADQGFHLLGARGPRLPGILLPHRRKTHSQGRRPGDVHQERLGHGAPLLQRQDRARDVPGPRHGTGDVPR